MEERDLGRTSSTEFETIVVLPFRGFVSPGSLALVVPGDETATTFTLYYRSKLPIPTFRKLDTSSCTIVRLQTRLPRPRESAAPITDAVVPGKDLLERTVLHRLNHFITYLKFSIESDPRLSPETVALVASELRCVGLADIVYAEMVLGRSLVSRHWSSSLLFAGDQSGSRMPTPRIVEGHERPPKVWSVMTRAVDLVNHGYYLEGFVVGYALLDEKVQEFLRARLELKDLILDKNRFQHLWGPLMIQATKSSPLEDDFLRTEIEWINRKRNFIMHAGDDCTMADARRALQLVHTLLRFLNNAGAGFVLPKRLHFR